MKDISLVIAFSAGLLSFVSPCVLPLVPAYITYLTGTTVDDIKQQKNKLTVLSKAIGFSIGFSIIFLLMGLSISSLGKLFTVHQDIFRKTGGIIIIIFGLHISGLMKIKYLYYEKRINPMSKIKGNLSSILIWILTFTNSINILNRYFTIPGI